ncbi:hypothetical protein [Pseudoclavibacter sp. VKM Ac-2867]|uniref:hypothetical protein n=1 Tax=Pseudoclavibacter sp. VKM Ac-2867 TaxID=2783829 RepID=UPI00188BDE06|nr:hypothetical protein [Pseudoclavibacter sp. VKM Ac-2867]MBF4459228.1 hypothetical protein [Pseudoclavibacter sp. VKM Ac-2867]
MGSAVNGRFERLPERVDPSGYTIDVPASDPASVTEQLPPAGSPELIAATQLAQTSSSIGSRRRPQTRIGVTVLVTVLGGVALLAALQIFF